MTQIQLCLQSRLIRLQAHLGMANQVQVSKDSSRGNIFNRLTDPSIFSGSSPWDQICVFYFHRAQKNKDLLGVFIPLHWRNSTIPLKGINTKTSILVTR